MLLRGFMEPLKSVLPPKSRVCEQLMLNWFISNRSDAWFCGTSLFFRHTSDTHARRMDTCICGDGLAQLQHPHWRSFPKWYLYIESACLCIRVAPRACVSSVRERLSHEVWKLKKANISKQKSMAERVVLIRVQSVFYICYVTIFGVMIKCSK